ncbi:MAG: hypothetical protein Q8P24_07790, partial [Desulfobacterales bacterium]|nr:hypothetical protein [Desulfobacterales bacterium]
GLDLFATLVGAVAGAVLGAGLSGNFSGSMKSMTTWTDVAFKVIGKAVMYGIMGGKQKGYSLTQDGEKNLDARLAEQMASNGEGYGGFRLGTAGFWAVMASEGIGLLSQAVSIGISYATQVKNFSDQYDEAMAKEVELYRENNPDSQKTDDEIVAKILEDMGVSDKIIKGVTNGRLNARALAFGYMKIAEAKNLRIAQEETARKAFISVLGADDELSNDDLFNAAQSIVLGETPATAETLSAAMDYIAATAGLVALVDMTQDNFVALLDEAGTPVGDMKLADIRLYEKAGENSTDGSLAWTNPELVAAATAFEKAMQDSGLAGLEELPKTLVGIRQANREIQSRLQNLLFMQSAQMGFETIMDNPPKMGIFEMAGTLSAMNMVTSWNQQYQAVLENKEMPSAVKQDTLGQLSEAATFMRVGNMGQFRDLMGDVGNALATYSISKSSDLATLTEGLESNLTESFVDALNDSGDFTEALKTVEDGELSQIAEQILLSESASEELKAAAREYVNGMLSIQILTRGETVEIKAEISQITETDPALEKIGELRQALDGFEKMLDQEEFGLNDKEKAAFKEAITAIRTLLDKAEEKVKAGDYEGAFMMFHVAQRGFSILQRNLGLMKEIKDSLYGDPDSPDYITDQQLAEMGVTREEFAIMLKSLVMESVAMVKEAMDVMAQDGTSEQIAFNYEKAETMLDCAQTLTMAVNAYMDLARASLLISGEDGYLKDMTSAKELKTVLDEATKLVEEAYQLASGAEDEKGLEAAQGKLTVAKQMITSVAGITELVTTLSKLENKVGKDNPEFQKCKEAVRFASQKYLEIISVSRGGNIVDMNPVNALKAVVVIGMMEFAGENHNESVKKIISALVHGLGLGDDTLLLTPEILEKLMDSLEKNPELSEKLALMGAAVFALEELEKVETKESVDAERKESARTQLNHALDALAGDDMAQARMILDDAYTQLSQNAVIFGDAAEKLIETNAVMLTPKGIFKDIAVCEFMGLMSKDLIAKFRSAAYRDQYTGRKMKAAGADVAGYRANVMEARKVLEDPTSSKREKKLAAQKGAFYVSLVQTAEAIQTGLMNGSLTNAEAQLALAQLKDADKKFQRMNTLSKFPIFSGIVYAHREDVAGQAARVLTVVTVQQSMYNIGKQLESLEGQIETHPELKETYDELKAQYEKYSVLVDAGNSQNKIDHFISGRATLWEQFLMANNLYSGSFYGAEGELQALSIIAEGMQVELGKASTMAGLKDAYGVRVVTEEEFAGLDKKEYTAVKYGDGYLILENSKFEDYKKSLTILASIPGVNVSAEGVTAEAFINIARDYMIATEEIGTALQSDVSLKDTAAALSSWMSEVGTFTQVYSQMDVIRKMAAPVLHKQLESQALFDRTDFDMTEEEVKSRYYKGKELDSEALAMQTAIIPDMKETVNLFAKSFGITGEVTEAQIRQLVSVMLAGHVDAIENTRTTGK